MGDGPFDEISLCGAAGRSCGLHWTKVVLWSMAMISVNMGSPVLLRWSAMIARASRIVGHEGAEDEAECRWLCEQ